MPGVLDGIRVLDFGRYIAGPYCAALMAEHGAEVIRIEKREGSEDRFQAPVAATGEGALLPPAVTLSNALLIEQAVIKPDRVPTGNRGQTAAPVDLFRTRDGWVLCQVIGKPLFRRWAELMGEPAWLTDPRFKDDISRGNHGAIISAR